MNLYKGFTTAFFLLLTLFFGKVNAQSPGWLWAKGIGGDSSTIVICRSNVVDSLGNVYSTGFFGGTADFDPGVGNYYLTSIGYADVFISKTNQIGNLVWVKQIGGNLPDYSYSIALDQMDHGDIYIVGEFNGTTDFDPSAGTFNLASVGMNDIFITKLDTAGNLVWAKAIGGISYDYGKSINVDFLNNIYISGTFNATVDFDPGPGIFNVATPSNALYISKFDSAGNFKWVKTINGTCGNNYITSDIYGNVFTIGFFQGTIDFDPGIGIFNLTSHLNNGDFFISKLDSSGNFLWAISGGTNNYAISCNEITIDGSGNIYATGYFADSVDFDPGPGFYYLASMGSSASFISKSDNAGNLLWAEKIGGDGGSSIVLDPSGNGNIYIMGRFTGTSDFDPGFGTFNLTSNGTNDVFIYATNGPGNFRWAKAFGGTDDDFGSRMGIDGSGSLYLTGQYDSPTIVIGFDSLINVGYTDMFIARIDHTVSGVENISLQNAISIYPNPASDLLTINILKHNYKIDVVISDIAGKIIYKTTLVNVHEVNINTESFQTGLYFVKIQTPDFTETKKLVISK